MENNSSSCCSGKWCCPTLLSVVAGLIVIAAGITKITGGALMLNAVGGMALNGLHIDVASGTLTLVLGWIAAIIEIVAGLSFLVGCCRTSRWAGLLLSIVLFLGFLWHVRNLQPMEGPWWKLVIGFIQQVQLEILLFAVFFTKGWKLIRNWCGSGDCCNGVCAVPPAKK